MAVRLLALHTVKTQLFRGFSRQGKNVLRR